MRPQNPRTGPASLLGLQRRAGNAAVSGLLGAQPGTAAAGQAGHPLDAGTRARLESGLGSDLSDLRIVPDGPAAAAANAAAFTVGPRIVVDPARYAPDTASGDGLLAHEATHAIQQREAAAAQAAGQRPESPGSSGTELEDEADRAAVAVATHQAPGGLLTHLRSALSLRRCAGCSDPEKQRLDAFRTETSPRRLESMLGGATMDELTRLEKVAASADSLHRHAVEWERAVRHKDFAQLASLNDRSDDGFRGAYAPRILDLIMGGTTGITVDQATPGFADFVRDSLRDLLQLKSGFRLITELLATGHTVDLRSGAAQTTEATDPMAARGGASDDSGPATGGSGSRITLNPASAANEIGLTGRPGALQIMPLDPSMTVGHELIHALNNARGENVSPMVSPAVLRGAFGGAGLVRDPVTGEAQSPEELRTITGQTTFATQGPGDTAGPPRTFGPGAGITENDLRRESGLDPRVSHFGAADTVQIPLGTSRSVAAVAARYRLPSGAVPARATTIIRQLLERQGLAALERLPAETELASIPVPTGGHVIMHIRFVLQEAALAHQLEGLTVA